MSNWDDFKPDGPSVDPALLSRAAEDRYVLTTAEDYAMFQEMIFLRVCDTFLKLPPHLNERHFTDVHLFPMRLTKNLKLRTKELRFAYHGFAGSVRYGKVVVSETDYPRGYRISKIWTGLRTNDRKWVSWRDAVTNMFVDDLWWF